MRLDIDDSSLKYQTENGGIITLVDGSGNFYELRAVITKEIIAEIASDADTTGKLS